MKRNTSMLRLAVVAVVAGAACIGSAAHAQQDGMATEAMADEIRQRIDLLPADAASQVTVAVKDGRYEIGGLVHGTKYRQDAMDAIHGIDGLDQALVDIDVVPQ